MRIALYGTDEEKLEGHKQRLHKSIVGIGDTVEIICCQDEEELKAHLKDYQIIFKGTGRVESVIWSRMKLLWER